MKLKFFNALLLGSLFLVLCAPVPAQAKKKRGGGGPPVNCNQLGDSWKRRMDSAPYKKFSDKQVKKCVSTYVVSPKTVPIFVAAAFYFKSNDVRLDATSRLDEYACEDKIACGALYELVNKHTESFVAEKDSERFFINRMNKIRDKAFVSFNELKNARP